MKPRCYVSEHAHLEKQLEDSDARAEKAERAAANWKARYEALRALAKEAPILTENQLEQAKNLIALVARKTKAEEEE